MFVSLRVCHPWWELQVDDVISIQSPLNKPASEAWLQYPGLSGDYGEKQCIGSHVHKHMNL